MAVLSAGESPGAKHELRIARIRKRMFRQAGTDGLDLTNPGLLLVGALAIAAIGVIYWIVLVLSIALGPVPGGSAAYLTSLAGHPTLARADFIVFTISDILLVPAAFALYKMFKPSNRWLLMIAGAFIAAFVVIDVGVTEYNSLTLVQLAQNYSGATSEAQRATYLASTDGARGVLPIATSLSYLVSSIGFVFVAIATLRTGFRKAVGVVGVMGGVVGILAGFYVLIPAMGAFLLPSLAIVGLWCVFVGIRMFRVATAPGERKALVPRTVAFPPTGTAVP
jgi:hypothetical protein